MYTITETNHTPEDNKKKSRNRAYFLLLCSSYILMIISLIYERNSVIMSVAIAIRILSLLGLLINTKSKMILYSLVLQITSFVVVYIQGSILEQNFSLTNETMEIQGVFLQASYVMMGLSDFFVYKYTANLSTEPILYSLYIFYSYFVVVLILLATIEYLGITTTIIGLMVPVMEFSIYISYIVTIIYEYKFKYTV